MGLKIYFPILHPELVGRRDIDKLVFIDPGMGKGLRDPIYYCPEKFPLDENECKKYINELLIYGDFFKDPKEIQHNFLIQMLNKDRENISNIKSMIKKSGIASYEPDFYLLAQITLLLLWVLEERIIELERIDMELQKDLVRLKKALDQDFEDNSKIETNTSLNEIFNLLPYERLLPWFFLVMHEGDVLVTESLDLFDRWLDFGLNFELLQEDKNIKKAHYIGWQYLFKRRPVEEMDWLNKKYTVYYIGEEK